jgi:hypothetical protein
MSDKEQIISAIEALSGSRKTFEPIKGLVCSLYEAHVRRTTNLPDSSQNRSFSEALIAGSSALLFNIITGIHPRQVYDNLTTTAPART